MSLLRNLLGHSETRAVTAASFDVMDGFDADIFAGSMSNDKAMRLGAVFACVRTIAEDAASLPIETFRIVNRERVLQRGPRWIDEPTPEHTPFDLVEQTFASLELDGNAYAAAVRDARGYVVELWPLDHRNVHPRRRTGTTGPVVYDVADPATGLQGTYDRANLYAGQIVHVKAFGASGAVRGLSPLERARLQIGTGLALDEFAARFFSQGSNQSGYLKTDKELDQAEADRLIAIWMQKHSGLDNAHKPALATGGLSFEATSITNEQAQFLESRRYGVLEIARIFRVPPHKLAELSRATFCLPADAEVLTTQGPRPIVDVRVGDSVWSWDEGKWVVAPVTAAVHSGSDPILTVRTTNRTLRLNARHRVLARRKSPAPVGGPGGYQCVTWTDVWVPAGDLLVGDTLVTAGELPDGGERVCPTRDVSVGFAEFCGLLLGDGNVNANKGVTIARAAAATYMDHYRAVMRDEFTNHFGVPVHLNEQPRQTRFSSVKAARELTELGLSGTARTKRVPGWVFGLTADLRAALVRGFLDADGSVDKLGRMSFSSCNPLLLSQIRHLCIGLGVPATNMRCQEGETRLPNGRMTAFKQWTFTASDPTANLTVIGTHTLTYVERLAAGRPFDRKDRGYPRHGGQGFEAGAFALSRISSISVGAAEDVYDLEVGGTHSFVADGVVVHNSNIEQQGLEYVTGALTPRLTRVEQAWSRLLPDGEFFRFNVDGLLRGDMMARAQAAMLWRSAGVKSQNELRRPENLPSIGPEGDALLVPLNMAPNGPGAAALPPPNVPPAPTPEETP